SGPATLGRMHRPDVWQQSSPVNQDRKKTLFNTGASMYGFRARERDNRRDEVHEEAKTEPLSSVQYIDASGSDSGIKDDCRDCGAARGPLEPGDELEEPGTRAFGGHF